MAESWKTKYGKAIAVVRLLSEKPETHIAPVIADSLKNFLSIVDTDLPQEHTNALQWFMTLSKEQRENVSIQDVWEAAINSVHDELETGRKMARAVLLNVGSNTEQ